MRQTGVYASDIGGRLSDAQEAVLVSLPNAPPMRVVFATPAKRLPKACYMLIIPMSENQLSSHSVVSLMCSSGMALKILNAGKAVDWTSLGISSSFPWYMYRPKE